MQTLAIVLLFVLAAPFQRIETQNAGRERVMRVETAMNHLTVIELGEPVTLAAAGSPLFKIERRENKGFVQRSEERRVGEEGRYRWAADHLKKKKKKDM